MKLLKRTKLKNILPKKERRLLCLDGPLKSKEPILCKKRGRRYFGIIDGNHRYFKQLDNFGKEHEVEVLVKYA
jgi:hypothetical protein